MNPVLYLIVALSAAYAASFTRDSLATSLFLEKRQVTAPETGIATPSGNGTSTSCQVVKPHEMLDDLIEMVTKTLKTVEGILKKETSKLEKLQNQKPEGICTDAITAQKNRVRIAGLIVDGTKAELAKLLARKKPGSQSEASEIAPQMSFADSLDQ